MKRIFIISIVFVLFLINANAQNINAASPYVFPEFVDATVLQKNGARTQAKMNYQKVTEEMLFLQDGKKIVLGNPEVIDTIYIGERKFVPARAVFLEKLTNTPVALYMAHKGKLISPHAKNDNNRVDNGNNRKTVSDLEVYELAYPTGYEVANQYTYWINHGLEFIPVQDLKRISKAFPEKAKSLNDFAQAEKINVLVKEDLIKLVAFLSK